MSAATAMTPAFVRPEIAGGEIVLTAQATGFWIPRDCNYPTQGKIPLTRIGMRCSNRQLPRDQFPGSK